MQLSTAFSSFLLLSSHALSQSIGYNCNPHCINPTIPTTNRNLTFGRHYAVLNLDLIGLVDSIANSTAGSAFINSTASWIDFIHAQNPPPLSIFSRVAFSGSRKPELGPKSPFTKVAASVTLAESQIYPAFKVDEQAGDVVLNKSRYYAGWGNPLETILRAQQIDTVILSGLTTSGVILNTVYTLYNLDYKVYVIANNTIQPPGNNAPEVYNAILEGIIPSLPADVITVEQARDAVKRSGPAIY
ncbi:hypothetical protein PRZ48_014155 [Zasmidium cellare]|uniref:Isochorismatase-like domain-containing protein n=1 Tax=Zasmidium cellare TaxID=395010 RepID=A0ABR0E064_ZASCE|nr:hypothetical protein PRZ48_014155 [Zasmidium cellare]